MTTRIITLTDAMGQNPYEVIIIENEDGTTTSMLKSTYDAMQAEQSTPNLTD
jgi:hypothetical protein